MIHARGNAHAHVVLRGGSLGPNYDSVHIALCEQELERANLPSNIMVDCSHANSNKDYHLQPLVLENVTEQMVTGNRSVIGAMLESNIESGNQAIPSDLSELRYGVSVTDACIDWDTTEKSILTMRDRLKDVLPQRFEGLKKT